MREVAHVLLDGFRAIDLTQPIHPRMPVALGLPRVMLTRYLDQSQGDVATVEILQASLHSGTHVDAPFHFVPDGPTIDALDPLSLCGTALLVDIPPSNRWRAITADSLRGWEDDTGERIGEGDVVLVRTGHSRWWRDIPEGNRYLTEPWPYLVREAADLLVDRGVRALGVECPDPDMVDQRDLSSASFEVHHRLLGAGIPIIENLANLDAIPVRRVQFLALPLPIRGASASPIRALALIPA